MSKPNGTALQSLAGLALLGIGVWLMSPAWALVIIGGIVTWDGLLKRARKEDE